MLTEEIGQYYVRTQRELEVIKVQLESLPLSERNGPQGELLQQLYKKVQESVNQIQGNIKQNSDFFFNQLINNFEHTIQRLPSVPSFPDESKLISHHSQRKSQIALPMIDQMVRLKGQSSLNFKPLGKVNYAPKGIHKQSSATLLKKKPSRAMQDEINISEKDIAKEGLINLINKGKLSNGPTANQFLNVGLLRNSQVALKPFKEQYSKQTILLEHENKTEMHMLDLETKIEPTRPSRIRSTMAPRQTSVKMLPKQTKELPTVENAMTVNEVMDTFSLHNFMIRHGKTVEEALEFQSFKRTHLTNWLWIQNIIKSLEKIAIQADIPLAIVNGKFLVDIAHKYQGTNILSLEELVLCFENSEEFIVKLQIPKLLFKGPNGRIRAIIKIQALFRMAKAQRDYARLKIMVEKIKIIQYGVRTFLLHRSTKRLIHRKNQEVINQYQERQKEFKSNWNVISLQHRVEIHLNNFAYEESRRLTMEKFLQRQNAQITRVFQLRDPLISVVYVAPFDLQVEIMNYFYKILELAEIPNFRERLHFVWPENHLSFPSHFSTSRLLMYSPKCLKRIKSIIKNRVAYIVPGYPSNDDIKLSHALSIPLMSGEPQSHLILSTKSGSKRLFHELQIPCAPGAFEIYDEKELVNTLAILITNNPQVTTWLLKIDDECQGRGIASLELRKLGNFFKEGFNSEQVVQVAQILHQKLPTKLNICYPQLFTTYAEFMSAFTRRGGIVEACPSNALSNIDSPSLFFRIDPTGKIEVLGTFDKIRVNDFQTIACSGPKRSIPNVNVQYICEQIGQKLYQKGLFGYMQLDLIAFQEQGSNLVNKTKQQGNLFWAVGIECYLTTMSCSCFYFDLLMKGKLDQLTGNYQLENEKRFYLYSPLIINEGLDALQYKTFFQLCRLESISFNLERKMGSTFILIDSLQSGVLSVMTAGDSFSSVLKYMADALEFLVKNVGRGTEHHDPFDSRSDKIRMMAILQKLKILLKKTEVRVHNPVSKVYL